MLSLHLGVSNLHLRYIGVGSDPRRDDGLIEWHKRRSLQILQTIIVNDQFARRVQTLKIYAPSHSAEDSDALAFQMGAWWHAWLRVACLFMFAGLLACAIPKLINLRTLECNGFLFSRAIIVDLPTTVPRLKALRLTCVLLWSIHLNVYNQGWYNHLP